MKILNFGSCNIDYVYKLDDIVTPGETETSELMEMFPGGKGLNQSIAVANAAARLLRETEMPIDDVIKYVGYTNGGFFRSAFKERYGMNLVKYRKSVTGKAQ